MSKTLNKKTVFINDIIYKYSELHLEKIKANGSMPAGNNGPWNDIDTPVRNTAHWALIFFKAYQLSKEDRFLNATISACDYLLSRQTRPYNAAFLCRLSTERDKANGLIGQVWAIEPLLFIGKELGRKDYLYLAEEVLMKHTYDEKLHLWHNLNVDGNIGPINETFNQQLWFAVINLLVGKANNNEKLLRRSRDFFNNINKNLFFMEPGLIRHRIPQDFIKFSSLDLFSRLKICTKKILWHNYCSVRIRELSIGYLSFNLYALALAYANAPDEKWWDKKWFKKIVLKIIKYIQSENFIIESETNKYDWIYNPVGFEVGYALYIFKDILNINGDNESLRYWVKKQLKHYSDLGSAQVNDKTTDKITFSARLYEATRLPNIRLDLNDVTTENNEAYYIEKRSLLSVIICTHNRSNDLKDTLDSLLTQTVNADFDYEIIMVDNNSKDKTKEVIESYKDRFDGKLKYLFEPRQGKPYALNKGINEAKGEIIAFTDDDCIVDKKWLFNIKQSFDNHNSEIGIVGGKCMPLWCCDHKPEWLGDYFLGPLGILDYGNQPIIVECTTQKLFFGNNFAFKKKLFDTYGGFDARMINAHDTEICHRFLKAGVKGLYNPDIKILHKIPTNRLSPKYFYRWFYRRGKFWDNIYKYKTKFYYPMNIPIWFIKEFAKEGIKFLFTPKGYNKVCHGCRWSRCLGIMVARIKKNII